MLKSFVALCAFSLAPFCFSNAKSLVAITKIAPHPSLDEIEKGVIDGLKQANLDLDFQQDNAQGNMTTATQIAKKYASLKPDIIIPITTPSTQTVYQTAAQENIPVVFAAVSDPIAAKLVDATTHKGKNITGVSDLSPIAQQIDLIKTLQPTAKKIGILYNSGETNSIASIDLFKLQAKARGLEIVLYPCTSVVDLMAVTKKIKGKVDALYIPNDNMVISGLDVVLKNLDDLAIYTADPESIARGCLASAATKQYDIGLEAGKLAARILKGETASDIPFILATGVQVTINKKVADNLKIEIPQSIKKTAKLIGE